MNKNKVFSFINENKSTLLTAGGIVLFGVSIGTGIHATIKAVKKVDERKSELGVKELEKKEIAKAVVPLYIVTGTTALFGTACVLGANHVSLGRIANLAAMYKLSEDKLKTYKEKTEETVGEEKALAIRDSAAEDMMKKYAKQPIYDTGKGTTRMFDTFTGTPFWSDVEAVRASVNDINNRLLHGDTISLNDWRWELGLPLVDGSYGDHICWVPEKGFIEVIFGSKVAEDGEPCLTLTYATPPEYHDVIMY